QPSVRTDKCGNPGIAFVTVGSVSSEAVDSSLHFRVAGAVRLPQQDTALSKATRCPQYVADMAAMETSAPPVGWRFGRLFPVGGPGQTLVCLYNLKHANTPTKVGDLLTARTYTGLAAQSIATAISSAAAVPAGCADA